MKKVLTSESVTEGHPDKMCDQISDAILDAYLEKDPDSRVAVETLATKGFVIVAGEVTSKATVNLEKVVRDTIKEIGYDDFKKGFDYKNIGVIIAIHPQSPDIARGVNEKGNKEQGAGDQGMMFGFACDETKEFLPLPIVLAHKLTMKLSEVRKKGILSYLGPDGKSQVSVEYEDNIPKRVKTVVLAAQHDEGVDEKRVREDLIKHVIKPVLNNYLDSNTKILINATGRFVIGGPAADTGLTGRKIMVDTYGSLARHGGGCFSGKDPSKVDRSAAYMARYIAKNLVAAGVANRIEIQIAYAIGCSEPVSLYVNTFGTSKISEEKIIHIIKKYFPLKPKEIIDKLDLKKPIYKETARYGHFGRDKFTWEKLDMVELIRKEL